MTADTKEKPKAARGLGKGLSALMSESYGQAGPPVAEPAPETASGVSEAAQGKVSKSEPSKAGPRPSRPQTEDGMAAVLALDEVRPGKFQPRDHFDQAALMELTESVRKNGVVQPILVRRVEGGKYEIIAGERRWRASNMAGLRTIPAIIREFDDQKALEIALIENVQREDLNPLDEAAGYQRLMFEFNYTQEQLAQSVYKSRSHIANLLRLLELPEPIRLLLIENKLTMGHARALAGSANAEFLANEVVSRGLSVRQTEKLVRLGKGEKQERRPRKPRHEDEVLALIGQGQQAFAQPAQQAQPQPMQPAAEPPRNPAYRDPDIVALEETLSENLGLKVRINDRGQSGEITILYEALDQLDEILRRLGGSI